MELEIDIRGDKAIARYLELTGKRARSLKPVFQSIAGDLRRSEKRLFTSQGASGRGKWEPLAASTIAGRLGGRRDSRAQRFRNPKTGRFQSRRQALGSFRILNDTGTLRNSLTSRSDPNHIEDADRDGLTFGTRVSYAKYHQTGTRRMPARPPVQLSRDQEREAVRKIRAYVITGKLR